MQTIDLETIKERARLYLSRIQSIQGSGGSEAAFRAAQSLIRGFLIPFDDAHELLSEWSTTNANPPWSERELVHKLKDARDRGKMPEGYLLAKGNHSFLARTTRQPSPRQSSPGLTDEEKRSQWPQFRDFTHKERELLMKARHLHPLALRTAEKSGFIKAGIHKGHPSYFFTQGTFAQSRRLDGGKFFLNGKEHKSLNLPGTEAKGFFLGATPEWMGDNSVKVLLVEGCIKLLEALSLHYMAAERGWVNGGWTILAAASASTRFADNPALLESLAGRHIRIVPDMDEGGTGFTAAADWFNELRGNAATIDARKPPPGCKDLGDFLATYRTNNPEQQPFINQLFQ